MTGEHPREYIITEAQITAIENHGWIDAFSILEQVRNQHASHSSASEPVPEQMGDPWNCTDLGIECPDPEQDWCSWPCDKWLLCHDASIATKARADVLDAFTGFIDAYSRCDEDGQDYVSVIALQDHIESLRQQEGKP